MKFVVQGFDFRRHWTTEEFILDYRDEDTLWFGQRSESKEDRWEWRIELKRSQVEKILKGFTEGGVS